MSTIGDGIKKGEFKPALDTLLEINNKPSLDLYWLLYGEKQTTRQKNNAEGKFNIKETDMIENFDKLNLDDQDEIIEFFK